MNNHSVLVDILSLVEVYVTEDIVSTWTEDQLLKAELWACRLHLKAGDHRYIRVPKMPEFLSMYYKKNLQIV